MFAESVFAAVYMAKWLETKQLHVITQPISSANLKPDFISPLQPAMYAIVQLICQRSFKGSVSSRARASEATKDLHWPGAAVDNVYRR